jgi:hypothetical protein
LSTGYVRSTGFSREREGLAGSLKRGSPSPAVNLNIYREIGGRPGKLSRGPDLTASNCQAHITQTSVFEHVGHDGLAGEM